jgi:hypothetical protein
VEALPYDEENKAILFGYESFEKPQVFGSFGRGQKSIDDEQDLLRHLNLMPDGARVGVMWNWIGGGGHTIMAVKTNGKLLFVDPQSGEHVSLLDYKLISYSIGFGFYRMDNLEFKKGFDWSILAKGKGASKNRRIREAVHNQILDRGSNMTVDEARELLMKYLQSWCINEFKDYTPWVGELLKDYDTVYIFRCDILGPNGESPGGEGSRTSLTVCKSDGAVLPAPLAD